MDNSSVRLLMICHAEGMHDRYANLGQESSGLTARGWEQSDVLAAWLRTHEKIDSLISDSLLQSRLTAQRIGQAIGRSISINRELPGCPKGLWELPGADTVAPHALNQLHEHGPPDTPSTYAEFKHAVVEAVSGLLVQHWGEAVALVTCGDSIATIVRHLFGMHSLDVQLEHTSLTEVCYAGNHWRLNYVNRLEHVEKPIVVAKGDIPEASSPPQQQREDLSQIIEVYNRVATADLEQKSQDDLERVKNLLAFAKLPSELDVLDIGTGIGVLPIALAQEGARSVVGIDASPAMLEQAEYFRLSKRSPAADRVNYRLASAQSLPFFDERMDVVTCRLVLHHARKPERIMQEIVRVLKPQGVLLLAEALSADNPVKRATQNAIEERRNPSHVAARSAEQYDKLVTDAGLVIQDKETISFERELEEWLAAYKTEPGDAAIVREMIEAGLETDAAGINARRQGNTIVFDQRMYYIRAVKPQTEQ